MSDASMLTVDATFTAGPGGCFFLGESDGSSAANTDCTVAALESVVATVTILAFGFVYAPPAVVGLEFFLSFFTGAIIGANVPGIPGIPGIEIGI